MSARREGTGRTTPRRRTTVATTIGTAVLATAVVGVTVVGPRLTGTPAAADTATTGSGSSASSGSSGSSGTVETAKVAKRDLVNRETVDGTLGYGDASNVAAGRQGTITALPAVGAVVERGQSLLTVDDRTLPLFYGTVPLWRSLSAAATDGPDVRMLEENLVALGFGDGLDLVVDEHFDAATAAAVQAWQKSLGVSQTAIVEKGDAAVAPGPVRVKERKVALGDASQPGAAALVVTGTTRQVTVRLDVTKQSIAKAGAGVQIQLPGSDELVDGTIASVGTVATADSSGSDQPGGGDTTPKITVTVTLADPNDPKLAGLDEAPVSVKLTRSARKGVLAVPVNALLALREGGYAVERMDGSSHTLVGVSLGSSADGWVEVTGSVNAGDEVVVAS